MDSVKTYREISPGINKSDFRISRMEDLWELSQGEPDFPHRHEYHTLIFTEEAQGRHYVDFKAYELKPKQLIFVAPGQVHQVVEERRSRGFVVVFTDQFLIKSNIPVSLLADLNLYNDFGYTPPLPLGEHDHDRIRAYFEEIESIYLSRMQYKDLAMGSLLKLILIRSHNLCSLPRPAFPDQNSILSRYKEMIDKHYNSTHAISDYASLLSVTPDHLNRVVKAQTGQTAKEQLHSKLIVEAKRLLYFSDQTTKEIAFELGFTEPSNFATLFKKKAGTTPSEFRQNS